MKEFPILWKKMLDSEAGIPVNVTSLQKIMDAAYHPDKISRHNEFELVFFQDCEKGSFYIDDSVIEVHTNELILIKPDIPHYLKIECERPCRFLVLKFSFSKGTGIKKSETSINSFLSIISDKENNYGFFTISNVYCMNITSLMQQILLEERNEDDESKFLRKLLTMELFVWLSRSLRSQWELNLSSKSNKIQEILESAKKFIEENYSRNISLSDIAGYVYLSSSHFSRAFKKHYNISPIQYLLKIRIENAALKLEQTDTKVGEIAASVGFGAQQRFNDIFKKHMGVSPGEYRCNFRNSILNK